MTPTWRTKGWRHDLGLGPALTPLARPRLILVGCRWRYELGIASIVLGGLAAMVCLAGTGWTPAAVAGLATAVGVAAILPQVRCFAAARAWCIITPHRVRTCFAQAWIYNRGGQVPAVLSAKAMPFGERVLIWCRAGTSFDDIASASEPLAAACWAVDVIASRSSRFAQLVYLDVIRRQHRQPATGAEPGSATPGVPPKPWVNEGSGLPRPLGMLGGDDRRDVA